MPRLKKCLPSKHLWRPLKGGKYEECTVCKDIFPCRGVCDHLDCGFIKGGKPSAQDAALMDALGLDFDRTGLVPWKGPRDQLPTQNHEDARALRMKMKPFSEILKRVVTRLENP